MSTETPRTGTIQEAQARVLEMMTPTEAEAVEETVEETVEEEMQSTDPAEPEVEQTLEETEEDYTDEEEEPTQTYKLKVDGEEIEVTEEELLKGYSRQSDYSKKTQELAAQRKDLEAITSENQAARERMSQLIPELESNLLKFNRASMRSQIGTRFTSKTRQKPHDLKEISIVGERPTSKSLKS
mgnify:CR=1 FL=1